MVLALVATAALERRCATPGRATARVAAAEPDSDLDPDIHRGSVTELDYEGGSDDDFRDSQPSPTPSALGEDEGGTPGLGRRASAGKRKGRRLRRLCRRRSVQPKACPIYNAPITALE